jgi:hypothetical protein
VLDEACVGRAKGEERRLREALERAYAGDDPDLCRPSIETAEVFEDVLADLSARSARTRANANGAGEPGSEAGAVHRPTNGAAPGTAQGGRTGAASAAAGDG